MRKLFATLLLAGVCMGAMAQSAPANPANELLEHSKWKVGAQFSFMYNYNQTNVNGLNNSGFGLEIAPIVLSYEAWRGGSFTIGLLDMFFDFQYLFSGNRFFLGTGIIPVDGAKGNLRDISFSVPVGINQRLDENWGISLTAAAGIGIVNYSSTYREGDFKHTDSFHDTKNRVGFRLDLKANIWYQDLGLVVRYRPIAAKNNPYGSNIISGGLALRF